MKYAELSDLSIDELRERERELRKELFNFRFKAVTGSLEKPHLVRQTKRDVARLLTAVGARGSNQK